MNSNSAEITIILATYNRPETLKSAVQSVLNQTLPHWKLYVVGDCCDARTQKIMAPFEKDSRVFYINLSSRTGSQALPNSVGMHLAQTPFIAFLNHDDIWLPDHLEISLNHLKNKKSNFFLGTSISVSHVQKVSKNQLMLTTRMKTDPQRSIEDCFCDYHTFEPASSWVIKNNLAQRTGNWYSPYQIFRFPSQNWVMRAWRAGAKLATDHRITCIKMETHLQSGDQKKMYDSPTEMHFLILDLLKNENSDKIRQKLICKYSTLKKVGNQQLLNKNNSKRSLASLRKAILNLKFFAWLYYYSGIDIDEWLNKIYGRNTGANWTKLLVRRTNEKAVDPPDLDQLIREAKYLASKK